MGNSISPRPRSRSQVASSQWALMWKQNRRAVEIQQTRALQYGERRRNGEETKAQVDTGTVTIVSLGMVLYR